MKPLNTYLAVTTLALSGSFLFGGCYTQFALDDTDEEDAAYEQPSYVDQPPVCILGYAPGPIFIPLPMDPISPGAAGSASGSGGAVNHPRRESGKQRVPPAPGRPASPAPRSGGNTAPAPAPSAPATPAPAPVSAAPAPAAPAPAPAAPAAPARGSESRPTGGSGSRR